MGNSDSKSKFRESVYKLNNEVISSKNLEFWDKLWRIPTVAEEIFTLIQPDDVRMLRRQQPSNLATMLRQAVSQLVQIVDTPVPKYYPQATNCVRVLTRLVPFILEDTSDDFVEELFWSVDEPVERSENDASLADQLKGDDDSGAGAEAAGQTKSKEPLAVQMIHAIMGLLFLPEYTVSIHGYKGFGEERRSAQRSGVTATNSLVYPSLLWHAGVGYPDTHVVHSVVYEKNRKEVLKLLLTCFSGILYQTAETCTLWQDRFLAVATSSECPFSSTLFFSLMNMVVSYDPVGWGVPYAGSIVSDDRETLVDVSLQVLLVLLDFGQTSETQVMANTKPQPANTPSAIRPQSTRSEAGGEFGHWEFPLGVNVYRKLLSSLQREEDFQLIFGGLSRLLNNYHESMNTLLPNSIKQIKSHQELLVLLWKLLDENKRFLHFVLKKADVNQLVVPLLFLMYEGRQEPSKVGMLHICTFILLLLSGERDFGVSLNKPFDNRLPLADLPQFTGNHADLLIVCLHKIIVSGYEKLNSVYNCFLTIICNISPYCKKLHMVSAVRLLRLFKLFSQPRYLFDNEANHHLVFFLLETFDNIIQYQYEGNQQVVYAMIQNKNVFQQLNELQLPPVRPASSTSTAARQDNATTSETESTTEPPSADEAKTPRNSDGEFVPTEEWLMSWKKRLPLATSLRLLQYLVPQIENACEKAGGSLDEDAVIYFLRTTTMVGLLPVPHPIVIRKYQINQFTHLWFTTFTWGVIFLRNQVLPLFDGSAITLFTISVL